MSTNGDFMDFHGISRELTRWSNSIAMNKHHWAGKSRKCAMLAISNPDQSSIRHSKRP